MNDRDKDREWIKKHKERDYHQIKRQIKAYREKDREWIEKDIFIKRDGLIKRDIKIWKKTESWRK